MKIGLATSGGYPGIDVDDEPLAEALRSLGSLVASAVWDDPRVDWSSFDAVVIRSTWDFHLNAEPFLTWISLVQRRTVLLNTESLVRWNIHKSYLLQLASLGIETVPTVLVERDETRLIRAIAEDRGWKRCVVKPAISASSHRTCAFDAGDDAAESFAATIARECDVLVQPYIDDVDLGGERSYCVIDGAITHAVRRAPFNGGATGVDQPVIAARDCDVALVRRAVAALPEMPVYARIDIVELAPHRPAIAEVELIEPNLFLSKHPAAGAVFARAVLARLRSTTALRKR